MKTATAMVVSAIVIMLAVPSHFVDSGRANPINYVYRGEVTPPSELKPPVVTIASPENDTTYSTNNVSLILTAEIVNSPSSPHTFPVYLQEVYYKTDWQGKKDIYVFSTGPPGPYPLLDIAGNHSKTALSATVNLTAIPEGKHEIIVYAVEIGKNETTESSLPFVVGYSLFHMNSSSTVLFTIDAAPLGISFLSAENKAYHTPNVPLNFTVSEPVSKITYVLDGQKSVAIDGNTTLIGLPEGEHNIIVYAWDTSGNVNFSDVLYFTVKNSFPVVPVVVAVSVVAVAITVAVVASAGLLLYRRRRSRMGRDNSALGQE